MHSRFGLSSTTFCTFLDARLRRSFGAMEAALDKEDLDPLRAIYQAATGESVRGRYARDVGWVYEKCQDVAPAATAKYMKSRDRRSTCLLYTSPSPRDKRQSRMPSSA